jgi:hypothetical protein
VFVLEMKYLGSFFFDERIFSFLCESLCCEFVTRILDESPWLCYADAVGSALGIGYVARCIWRSVSPLVTT